MIMKDIITLINNLIVNYKYFRKQLSNQKSF